MKKALLIAVSVIVLIFTYSPKDFLSVVEKFPSGAVYEVYCESIEIEGSEEFVIFDNGSYKVGRCKLSNAAELRECAEKIAGERISFSGNSQAFEEIRDELKIKVIDTQDLDGLHIEYGFSPLFSKYIEYGGKKINIELSICDGTIMLASPINLGGY